MLAKQEELPPDPNLPNHPNSWHSSKHLSILLLGDLQAQESINVLMENIEYRNPKSIVMGRVSPDGLYPAVEALIKIGMPAVEPVINKMASYDKESIARENCIFILQRILGIRLAREKLKIAIEESKDPVFKKNLEKVLPLFKTDNEKFEEEIAELKKAQEAKLKDANKPK